MPVQTNSAGWRRFLKDPLLAALALSLAVHLAGALTWKLGDLLGWWKPGLVPKWVQAVQNLGAVAPRQIQTALASQARREPRMTFIEVDPAQAAEPPKEAEHYGAVSTHAANPDPVAAKTSKPKIDGREQPFEKITENRPLTKAADKPSKAFPLQPDSKAVPPSDNASEKKTKTGDQKAEDRGETLMAKADLHPKAGTTFGDPETAPAAEKQARPRPRTLAEAQARRGIPGERTRTEGGVASEDPVAFNVKGTPFGAYDARFVDAVREAWYQAMGAEVIGGGGDVQVRFNLLSNGRITDLVVVRTSVDELLTYYCRRAIELPAPFEEWPPEMRREIGSNSREITFTFHYLQ